MPPTDRERIDELQRQIVELRHLMELAHQREASLIEHYTTKAVAEQTRGRLPSAQVLAWCERSMADSIKRGQSIRDLAFDTFKMGAWAGVAFLAWAVWEGFKTKVTGK